VVAVDQSSKLWAVQHLASGELRPLLPGLLRMQRVSNTGAAFSLLSGSAQLLGLVSLLVSVGVVVWLLLRPPLQIRTALGVGFLLGGAVGNGLDRWRLGYVIDFLEFIPIHFPIFNPADIAINLAVACFLLDQLLPRPQQGDRTPGDRHDDRDA
jgi:signal peptidase II